MSTMVDLQREHRASAPPDKLHETLHTRERDHRRRITRYVAAAALLLLLVVILALWFLG